MVLGKTTDCGLKLGKNQIFQRTALKICIVLELHMPHLYIKAQYNDTLHSCLSITQQPNDPLLKVERVNCYECGQFDFIPSILINFHKGQQQKSWVCFGYIQLCNSLCYRQTTDSFGKLVPSAFKNCTIFLLLNTFKNFTPCCVFKTFF